VEKRTKAPLPEHVLRNRRAWDLRAAEYAEAGRRSWSRDEPEWGIWGIPESALHVLPEVAGRDTIELGCGTAYVSAWLARRGARPIGIDSSAAQLATARQLQREFGLEFPLLHGNAESVPLPAASFDLAISEYGACLWCDPQRWVPEAARLLRPGGELRFLTNGAILTLCEVDAPGAAARTELLRPYFGMHRFEWSGENGAVEFHLGHGDWIRLLGAHGFRVEDLIEVQAPPGAVTRYDHVTSEWANRWPSEEIWVAHKVR
jgi:SAM-dependent methyltransferase